MRLMPIFPKSMLEEWSVKYIRQKEKSFAAVFTDGEAKEKSGADVLHSRIGPITPGILKRPELLRSPLAKKERLGICRTEG